MTFLEQRESWIVQQNKIIKIECIEKHHCEIFEHRLHKENTLNIFREVDYI